jgi:hypothetical protein
MTTTLARSTQIELRVDIPEELAQRIDALMLVGKLKSRADYVVPILTAAVDAEFHKAILLLRMARINPLDSTDTGTKPD